jgi:hypothetical protein
MLVLSEYPAQIEDAINAIGRIEAELAHIKAAMDLIKAEVDRAIAFEQSDLTPFQQKAEREHRLGKNPNYYNLVYQLNESECGRTRAIAALERLKLEFIVAELEQRRQIAALMAGQESHLRLA